MLLLTAITPLLLLLLLLLNNNGSDKSAQRLVTAPLWVLHVHLLRDLWARAGSSVSSSNGQREEYNLPSFQKESLVSAHPSNQDI